jgi:hypothetical protein
MTLGNHTIIDIGEMVLCDLCNADYTDSEAEGGVLMGTYSICPTCAVVCLYPAGNAVASTSGTIPPFHYLCEGVLPWYHTSFSTS